MGPTVISLWFWLLRGVSFHPVVVIGLGKTLLFKSVLAHCAFYLSGELILLRIHDKSGWIWKIIWTRFWRRKSTEKPYFLTRPLDMLCIFFLIAIFIMLQKNALGQNNSNFMHGLKSTISEKLKNGTFEPMHEIWFFFGQKHSFEALWK